MKPLFIFLLTLASLVTKSSFAADETVSPAVLKSFQSRFANVKEVDWTIAANYYKAQFVLDGQHINAFYSNEGELMAMTRNITTLQLPLSLQTDLKKDYQEFWVTDLFEVANDRGTQYYITVENSETTLVLKATADSGWNTYQKSRKE